jgi:type IV secretion system protein VirD4
MTPGEVTQLPPAEEIVMVAGTPPIRAKKARYFEDKRLSERILRRPSSRSKPSSRSPTVGLNSPPRSRPARS